MIGLVFLTLELDVSYELHLYYYCLIQLQVSKTGLSHLILEKELQL